MSKLSGKIAYIAGGAGNVGEGIVRGFLKEGATVVTSSRSNEKLDRLRELLNLTRIKFSYVFTNSHNRS